MSAFGSFRRSQIIADLVAHTSARIDLCVTANKDGPTGVPADVSYVAQAITFSDGGDNNTLEHSAVTFPAMSTTITARWFVVRSATSSNMELYGQFTSDQTILPGNTFAIEANTLGITFDPV